MTAKRRLRSCVEQWPECETGAYDPRCCRFPKSCSADVYNPERVREEDLEPVTMSLPGRQRQQYPVGMRPDDAVEVESPPSLDDLINQARRSPPSLQMRGWTLRAVDLCWMRCSNPGFRKREGETGVNETEIVLCQQHAAAYEFCDPEPLTDEDDPTPIDSWWPWRRI